MGRKQDRLFRQLRIAAANYSQTVRSRCFDGRRIGSRSARPPRKLYRLQVITVVARRRDLQQLKDMLRIPEIWQKLDLPGTPRPACRSPFRPDRHPSFAIYDEGRKWKDFATGEFRFVPGPLFSQVVLADEVNRATPRTQSALLESMGERQVSLDGQTHLLGPPLRGFIGPRDAVHDAFGDLRAHQVAVLAGTSSDIAGPPTVMSALVVRLNAPVIASCRNTMMW